MVGSAGAPWKGTSRDRSKCRFAATKSRHRSRLQAITAAYSTCETIGRLLPLGRPGPPPGVSSLTSLNTLPPGRITPCPPCIDRTISAALTLFSNTFEKSMNAARRSCRRACVAATSPLISLRRVASLITANLDDAMLVDVSSRESVTFPGKMVWVRVWIRV